MLGTIDPPRGARPLRTAAAALAIAIGLGFGPPSPSRAEEAPEVVRLRVPGETLSAWFPGREGLTAIEPDRFEAMVRAARSEAGPGGAAPIVAPLRIEHRARLDGGLLVGSTTLRLPNDPTAVRWASLWPWSPALVAVGPAGSAAVVHRDRDGRAFLRLAPDPDAPGPTRDVVLSWSLRPRVEAEGRIFDLDLVEGPATALVLDLPEGVSPSGPPGYREGPEPTGEPGRARWRFDGPGGALVLRLRAGPDPDRPSGPWVGGPTLVEVGDAAPGLPAGSARWTARWEVDPGQDGHRPLVVRLGPGACWEDVSGPEGVVAGVEAAPEGDGTRLTVRWRDGLTGPTRLTIAGVSPVDGPGPWAVALPEPVGVPWTGGTVVVRVGPSWSLLGVRERGGRALDLAEVPPEAWETLGIDPASAGRRPAPGDAPGLAAAAGRPGVDLAFFADRPGPVADLTLSPGRHPASASVRGAVRVRGGADAIEAEVEYAPAPASASVRLLEVSPGWIPEAVRLLDGQAPPRWDVEPIGDGRRLLRVQLPGAPALGAGPGRAILVVSGTVEREDPETLALPRLRPAGEAIVDERWSAVAGPGVVLRPIEAEGLAWLAPAASPLPPGDPTASEGDARSVLSWRWVGPSGRAVVSRGARPSRPSATVSQEATIAGGRLSIDWRVRLDARGTALRALSYRIVPGEVDSPPPSWTAIGADGRESPPLADQGAGDAGELPLPDGPAGPVVLLGRLELPWDGEGPLPMLELPRRVEATGRVVLRVDPSLRCETRGDLAFQEAGESDEADGLDAPARPDGPDRVASAPTRRAASFRYDGTPGLLLVRTAPMAGPTSPGAILHAGLETWAAGDGAGRHRLSLDVAAPGAEALDVALPGGVEPSAVSVDGAPGRPIRAGDAIRIPIPRAAGAGPTPSISGRPSRVVIDYVASSPAEPGGVIEPGRPRFSMPCLSFSWRLAMPGGRPASSAGPALVPADPGPDRRGWLPGPKADRHREPGTAGRAMLDRLDARAVAQPPAGRPLGRVLASWDVGRWPLVVDRMALEARGLGPDSASPAAPAPPASTADRPETAAARRALAPLGLLVVPIDTVLLVTSEREAPRLASPAIGSGEDRDAWARSLREAVAWGSDRSGRFLTVESWRSAGTPVGPAGAGPAAPPSDAEEVRRFAATGWPGVGSGVRAVDPWPWSALGGGIGLALVLVGGPRLSGRWPAIARLAALVALAVALGLVANRGGPRASALASSAFYPSLVAAAVASARGRRRADPSATVASTLVRSHRSAGSRSRSRSGAGPGAGPAVALIVAGIASAGLAQTATGPGPGPGPDAPIIAFVIEPADGEDEPDGRVWLRAADLDRLAAAGAATDRDGGDSPAGGQGEGPGVGLVSAEHVLEPDGEGAGGWVLESRLALRFEREGPASWSLPIGRMTGVEASLDGRPRPVLVEPGGDRATVAIDGEAGAHLLVVRRRVRPEADAGGLRLSLPVNPAATARLDAAGLPGSGPPDVRSARGQSEAGPDGRLRVELGPVDRIEARWSGGGAATGPADAPRVESLLLWRAMPTADRLDARLTVRSAAPVRELWFAIEPGVAVRSVRAAGTLVEGARVVAAEGDRWVARLDPPLPDGGTIEVELWRPLAGPADGDGDADGQPRRPPLLGPIGVARYEGRIALMRPEGWSGRLGDGAGAGPATSDQEFEQEWGPLPRGAALDPSGAARFEGVPAFAVALGPAPPRRLVTPTLRLDLDAGRWDWRLTAELVDLDGRAVREAEVTLPADLELIAVEAAGLTAWERPDPGRLRLRFDGPAAPTRAVVVAGWLPRPGGAMDPGPLVERLPLPWPEWPGASARPGSLLLSSPNTALISYEGPDGVPVPLDRLASSNNRRPYRAVPVAGPGGSLRVEAYPAVAVEIWSQLTPGRRSARWEAMVRYEVTGGPADRIDLIVPDAWAEGAEYELEGFGPIAVRDQGDRVEIDPERPIWGAAEVRIRSVLPLEAGRPLTYPDLLPWGRGTYAHTVAVVLPAERAPTLDATGLERADAMTREQLAAAFPAPLADGASRTVYSVRQGGWSLVVRPPADGDPGASLGAAPDGVPGPDPDDAEVVLADLSCAIAPDGTLVGHAAFELAPGPSPFLSLLAPPGAVAPAAVVDGRSVRPLLDGEGGWVIPLGDGPARRVELAWIDPRPAPAGPGRPASGRRFSVPQPRHADAVALIRIACGDRDAVAASVGSVLPAPAASALVDRLELAISRVRARLDATGAAPVEIDRDALAAEVARADTLRRQAERAASWAALMRPEPDEVVRQRGVLGRILVVRKALDEAVAAAGLPGPADEATSAAADPGPPADLLSPLLPGVPRHFRARTEAGRPIAFEWTPAAPE